MKHQKKLSGPKNVAKHRGKAELDQQGDQTRRGRGREGSGDAGEFESAERNSGSGFRGYQETSSGSVAGGRVDGQGQELCRVPGELVEEVRNPELQEFYLRAASALKRVTGATTDATTEEIASWTMEADGIELEISGKKRKIQQAVEQEPTQGDIKM